MHSYIHSYTYCTYKKIEVTTEKTYLHTYIHTYIHSIKNNFFLSFVDRIEYGGQLSVQYLTCLGSH